jgi:hypothetical protein
MRLVIRWSRAVTSVAAVSFTAGVSAQAPVASARPQARASVNRTAMWVGDRVRFTIDIDCPRDLDVLDDDLAKDKLKLEGLDVVSSDSGRIDGPGETTTRRFSYELTTYRVDVPALRIAPLSVRYYVRHPGQRLEDAAPAGEVQIPGAAIAFRSTLPEAQAYNVRDSRPAMSRPRVYALSRPVGLALVLVSLAPAAFWAVAAVARRRHRTVHRSVRRVRSDERASFQAARELDLTSEEARREAYTKLDVLVREHLSEVCGVTGASLTPGELQPALAERGARIDAERVAALLAACERARYGPRHAVPSSDACRDAIAEAEQLLGAG